MELVYGLHTLRYGIGIEVQRAIRRLKKWDERRCKSRQAIKTRDNKATELRATKKSQKTKGGKK